jgi:hypothetical protein
VYYHLGDESLQGDFFSFSTIARMKLTLTLATIFIVTITWGQSGQLGLTRISQMPNMPSPFIMRDWRDVSLKYDQLIFNTNASGDYMPFVKIKPEGINYPSVSPMLMDTYVGTYSVGQAEAINILPSLVGATLVGIDKSNQEGVNWVLKAKDFYNKKNGQLVYLNGYSTTSGGDWWYDVMPNVYFYQLYDQYPTTPDFQDQFIQIADRWLTAVKAMGGSTTPWVVPNMNYRAFNLMTMQGNAVGVKEPETAGSLGWILYHAYTKTKDRKYLHGAQLSLEYLNNYTANPSYELQLPYGAFIAAKMNAELGTAYDVQKILNWCFNRGPLRGWGAIVGTWDGVDVHGLIGEANDNGNDYAFVMNGFQQAAALVPLMKYDKRFARDIAKWTLNVANASRLFYREFVTNQDDYDWSLANDPNGVIAYEALKQKDEHNDNKPLNATGDAKRGQWARTNLSLYSSSSVGYLGALIETTNVEGVLRLDLNATDFFSQSVYPSYAFYNPHAEDKQVAIALPLGSHDVYDAIRETVILNNVSGNSSITIKAGEVVLLTYIPAGSERKVMDNKLWVNGKVIDHRYGEVAPQAFRIKAFSTTANATVSVGQHVPLFVTVEGASNPTYDWEINLGGPTQIEEQDDHFVWTVPNASGQAIVRVNVSVGELDLTDTLHFIIVDRIPAPPVIESFSFDKQWQEPLSEATYHVSVKDEFDPIDNLQITWTSLAGTILSQDGNSVRWKAPSESGVYTLRCKVEDSEGMMIERDLPILVRPNQPDNAPIFAYYPLNGDVQDHSGNNHHATMNGVDLTTDARGVPNSAYYFNSGNDLIKIQNSTDWNFRDAITLSFWVKLNSIPEEVFILSHGSWEERWKISVTPDRRLRWTIKTSAGTKDLDNSFVLENDVFYHFVAVYSGTSMELYHMGALDAFTAHAGLLATSNKPITFGRKDDTEQHYYLRGSLDEVRIYNTAVSMAEIETLKDQWNVITGVETKSLQWHLFPNPTKNDFVVAGLPERDVATLRLQDLQGREIEISTEPVKNGWRIVPRSISPGVYMVTAVINNHIHRLKLLIQY